MSWGTVPLADLCEINVGRTPARANPDFWGAGEPWLSIADMNQGKVITRTKEQITASGARSGKQVPPGTVLLSFKLSIGKVSIAGIPLYTNEAIAALPVKYPDQLDASYLLRALAVADLAGGSNRAAMGSTLNKAKLAGIEIPLPPIDEQRRIATILDQADALRAKRRQVHAHLDTLTQSIFHEFFSRDKEVAPLGENLEFITSGGRGWAKYYSQRGARFIQSFDVQVNRISNRDPIYVTPPDNAEANRTRTRADDVLLTITGSRIGRAATIPQRLAGSYVSQHVAILRPDREVVRPAFLSTMLTLANLGQRLIRAAQYGQTKPGLNFEQIRGFTLPCPPLVRQDAFLERAALVDRTAERLDGSYAIDDQLFASLQARAFSRAL